MVKKTLERLGIFFRLIRWPNLVIIALTMYFTHFFLIRNNVFFAGVKLEFGFMMMVLGTLLVAAGGYVMNDIYDVTADLVNKPKEIIVEKNINTFKSWLLFFILASIGLLIGTAVSYYLQTWDIFLIFLFVTFLLWAYTKHLKHYPILGNIAIAGFIISTMFVVISYNLSWDQKAGEIIKWYKNVHILLFLGFAFFTTLLRELIKDVEDIEGDMVFGSNTLPILVGAKKSKLLGLLYIIILVAMIGVYIAWMLNKNTYHILPWVLIPLALSFIVDAWLMRKIETKHQYHQISRIVKLQIVYGVLSMMFLNLVI